MTKAILDSALGLVSQALPPPREFAQGPGQQPPSGFPQRASAAPPPCGSPGRPTRPRLPANVNPLGPPGARQ